MQNRNKSAAWSQTNRYSHPGLRGPGDPSVTVSPLAIDPTQVANYSCAMTDQSPKQQFELELKKLENRISELLRACGQLKEENRSLRHRQDSLISERAGLLQKNEQVRARVESMISRLKAMETGS